MILVVGATGHLGGLITHALLDRGMPVRAMVRPGSSVDPRIAADTEVVTADLKDQASLRDACAGVSAVVTTATATDRQGDDTIESVDRRGAMNLVEAAEAHGVQRFVFISALGADPNHPMPLLRAKGAVEQRLRASQLAWTIIQPNMFLDKLPAGVIGGPALAGQPVTLVGEGTHRHSMVATRDAAAYAVAALEQDEAVGQTLVVGGPRALSMRDIVEVFEGELGRPVPVQTVQPGHEVPGMPPVVSELLAALETYDSPIDSSALAATYGISQTSVEEVVRAFVEDARRSTGRSRTGPVRVGSTDVGE